MDYAHGKKIIHRDVKPENIMFFGTEPKLIDFGISAKIHETKSMTTGANASSGTPGYMAPEQLNGENQGPRTDQYSLAVIAYEFLAGRPLYTGTAFAIMNQALTKIPSPLSQVPDYANAALLKALEKKPTDRFGSCIEFIDALTTPQTKSKPKNFGCWTLGVLCVLAWIFAGVFLGDGKNEVKNRIAAPIVTETEVETPAETEVPEKVDRKLEEAESFYISAQSCRENAQYSDAEKAICQALELFPDDDRFLSEQRTIAQLKQAEADAKAATEAKQKAETEAKLAAEAAEKEAEARKEAEQKAKAEAEARQKAVASEETSTASKSDSAVAPESERKAGELMTKTVDGIEYRFRWCPPGDFMMGSPSSEEGRSGAETQHRVTLTKGFWMLETEVTQAMWESVMKTTVEEQAQKMLWDDTEYNFGTFGKKTLRELMGVARDSAPSTVLYGEGNDLPMYYVNWNECQEFCRMLTEKIGMKISLPTEAQWEYACRAGTTTSLNSNEDMEIKGQNNAPKLDSVGWYGGNSMRGFTGESAWNSANWPEMQYSGGPCGVHPVKQKLKNNWNLYDMHGNVFEWCQDWYGNYPSNNVTDPTGPDSGSFRVDRGGSWGSNAKSCRSAYRGNDSPGCRISLLGLRILLEQ